MSLERLHMAHAPLSRVLSVAQDPPGFPERTTPLGKPKGLWYGIGPSWLDWCTSERMDWIGPYWYRLTLDESRLLRLTTTREMYEFSKTYIGGAPERYKDDEFMRYLYIDWTRVAREYGGIEIAPRQSCRFEKWAEWYWGWDVASGCVWDASLVLSLDRVERPASSYADDAEDADESPERMEA